MQARTLKTREKLMAASFSLLEEKGYDGFRVEEAIKKAGVAKGTFFKHFADKDAVLELYLVETLRKAHDDLVSLPMPQNVDQLTVGLMKVVEILAAERTTFDLAIRYSGAAARDVIGPLALYLIDLHTLVVDWMSQTHWRQDISPQMLAEGVQAFMLQAIALDFCALHKDQTIADRFRGYLKAWVQAPTS